MFQDNISIKGHLQRETLGFIGESVLLDIETSGIALFNSENPSREGDVLQLYIMKERPQVNTEHPGFWDRDRKSVV